MALIDANEATRFAADWLDAWNRHDLDAVLAHYADEVEFASPLIVTLAGEPSGVLRGKPAIRAYWSTGLQRIPDLRFELVDVLAGIDQITLYYRGHRGMVTEVCQFDASGRIVRASACYALADAGPPAAASLNRPALDPATVVPRTGSSYPLAEQRASVEGRAKRALGDPLGLQTFGVNLATIEPGSRSALRHWHTRQDEFIYVLDGELTLVTDAGEQVLRAGMCAGFPAGVADGHCLRNDGSRMASYLEVGDRLPGDRAFYPEEDLQAVASRNAYAFVRRDDSAFED